MENENTFYLIETSTEASRVREFFIICCDDCGEEISRGKPFYSLHAAREAAKIITDLGHTLYDGVQ